METITTVSKSLGISTRMLRYYEKIGLIASQRKVDYAYRVYDEGAVSRLRQIIILRKLHIPVKEIREIFASPDALKVVAVFEENIRGIDQEILV